ncbi:hypothetical protein BH09BAC1_BH09BAC1_18310 [soil metagenome]
MKKGNLLILLLLALLSVYGQQQDIHQMLRPLFTEDGIAEAERLVDQYLKEDPKNVDALMYKGNVVYYKYKFNDGIYKLTKGSLVSLISVTDENIYESTIAKLGEHQEIVPADVANEAIQYWLLAVSINHKREDIHLGISHLYSISLQTDKLINYLPTAAKNSNLSAYDMANYARNIKERGKWEDAMKVYVKISEIFPDLGGILSDIAYEYFEKGDAKMAIQYIDQALLRKNVDEMTYGNAFFMLSVMGDYERALKALKAQSKLTKTEQYLLYQGIVELLQNKPSWKKSLESYQLSPTATKKGKALAEMLLNPKFKTDLTTLDNLSNTIDVNDGYKLPLYEYFYKNNTTNTFEPLYAYAEALTYNLRYPEAVKIFAVANVTNIPEKLRDDYYLHYAWAKYSSGDAKGALSLWEPLLKSEDFFNRSAAAYFMGKYYLEVGNKAQAKEYFSLFANSPSKSKYANLSSQLLEGL